MNKHQIGHICFFSFPAYLFSWVVILTLVKILNNSFVLPVTYVIVIIMPIAFIFPVSMWGLLEI